MLCRASGYKSAEDRAALFDMKLPHLSPQQSPRPSLKCQSRESHRMRWSWVLDSCHHSVTYRGSDWTPVPRSPAQDEGTGLRARWRCPAGPAAGNPAGAFARSRCCLPGWRSPRRRTSGGHARPLGTSLHKSDKPLWSAPSGCCLRSVGGWSRSFLCTAWLRPVTACSQQTRPSLECESWKISRVWINLTAKISSQTTMKTTSHSQNHPAVSGRAETLGKTQEVPWHLHSNCSMKLLSVFDNGWEISHSLFCWVYSYNEWS